MPVPQFHLCAHVSSQPEDEYQLNESDSEWLRQAFVWANAARLRGNRPFGAIIVTANGRILAEAFSNSQETGDYTGHAEMNAIRQIGTARVSAATIAQSTLYCSAEPCPMCASAISMAGLRRVVFGVDWSRLEQLQPQLRTNNLSCHDIFGNAAESVDCIGPCLIQEALAVYQDHWFNAPEPSSSI